MTGWLVICKLPSPYLEDLHLWYVPDCMALTSWGGESLMLWNVRAGKLITVTSIPILLPVLKNW
jgi:hypothetical protein